MFLDKLELNNQEIKKKEEEFQALILNVPEKETVFIELRDFFSELSLEDSIKKYWATYWRWYVWLIWDRLNSSTRAELAVIFGSQIPMALLLGFDVFKLLMLYFVSNNYSAGDIDSVYIEIKKSFQESTAVVGAWKEREVTVAELVKEIQVISKRNDSLEQAEFESKLKEIMFPNDPLTEKYLSAEPDQAVQRFVDLVVFFDAVKEGSIWFVVDNFLNPEKYQNVFPGKMPAPTIPSSASASAVTPKPSVVPSKPEIKPEPKKEEVKPISSLPRQSSVPKPTTSPQSASKPPAPAKPTPQEIKLVVDSQFKKDAEGNFADVAAVMAKLSELAEKYNDQKIADMVYYDEKENKFKWSI